MWINSQIIVNITLLSIIEAISNQGNYVLENKEAEVFCILLLYRSLQFPCNIMYIWTEESKMLKLKT
jgi:hypothetical protein